jgi:hypothetical protein
MLTRSPVLGLLVLAALGGCHSAHRPADAEGPTTERVRTGEVECSHPRSGDVQVEASPTASPLESSAGWTQVYWWLKHGCAVKAHPRARAEGNRLVIELDVEGTGVEHACCPVQDLFRTRFPHLTPGSYDLVLGSRTFPVQAFPEPHG